MVSGPSAQKRTELDCRFIQRPARLPIAAVREVAGGLQKPLVIFLAEASRNFKIEHCIFAKRLAWACSIGAPSIGIEEAIEKFHSQACMAVPFVTRN